MSSSQFNQDNELDDVEKVTLKDESGRSLECYIENSLETDDLLYLLLMPVDIPVVVLAWDAESDEEEDISDAFLIEDNEEIEKIFADAKAVLAEQNLILKYTAYTLTVSGELPPLEEDNILTLEIDLEGQPTSDPEELQYLSSFYSEEQKYSIYTPLDPLLFLAKCDSVGNVELVSPEDQRMQAILEELLFDEMEDN
jgi:Protein of unknown function (DUF3727)/Protein of unknown function (DUF1292)